jgi:hypothetical protein
VEVNPSVTPQAPPPSFRVVAEWSGPASASVAHGLRRVDRQLGQRPAGLVLEHLRGRQGWDLGVHERQQAERLEARCRREGLRVRRVPARADETGRSLPPEPPSVPVDRGVTVHFVWIVLAVGALVAGTALWLSG